MSRPLAAFVQAGKGLNLVANFGVARQIGRLDPALADAVRGLLLGAVILRLLAGVHQTGGFPGDLPPELAVLHRWPPKAQDRRHAGMSRHKGGRVESDSPANCMLVGGCSSGNSSR